jgi:guanylate kinase
VNAIAKPGAPARGLLIVLSGPAGVGKDTLIEQWQLVAPNVRRLVTYTTRPQALTERHGLDYYFVTEEEFEVLREQGAFIEYAQVHGNWYGTPRREMENLREAGRDVVLRIDVQGAMQVREQYPEAILIFVAPPSLQELEQRLRRRGRDDEESIQLRLMNAREEMEYVPRYDYLSYQRRLEPRAGDATLHLDCRASSRAEPNHPTVAGGGERVRCHRAVRFLDRARRASLSM